MSRRQPLRKGTIPLAPWLTRLDNTLTRIAGGEEQ